MCMQLYTVMLLLLLNKLILILMTQLRVIKKVPRPDTNNDAPIFTGTLLELIFDWHYVHTLKAVGAILKNSRTPLIETTILEPLVVLAAVPLLRDS